MSSIETPSRSAPYHPSGPVDPAAAQLAALMQAHPAWRDMTGRPAHETRALFQAAAPIAPAATPGDAEDVLIPGGDAEVRARLYRPEQPATAVMVWAHGGGFVLGGAEQCDSYARELMRVAGCAVLSVDYRLAPEHRFPAGLDDVVAAARWAAARRDQLAAPGAPLLLGGDSAGGNLATVAARRLAEAGEDWVAGQALAYPCTDTAEAESLRRFEPPYLTQPQLAWFYAQYQPDPQAQRHPDFAPLNAHNPEALPPTLIITAEHDILTEQGEAYGAKLAAAGVPVRIRRYPGMIHGFLTKELFFDGAAGEAIAEISDFVRELAR
jgi:acetyl esterase